MVYMKYYYEELSRSEVFIGSHILFIIMIGCISFLIMSPLPAAAIKVGGSVYTATITPGSTDVHIMNISTSATDPPMDLMVEVLGLGENLHSVLLVFPPTKT